MASCDFLLDIRITNHRELVAIAGLLLPDATQSHKRYSR